MVLRERSLKPQAEPLRIPTRVAEKPSGLNTFHSLKDPNFTWFFMSTLGQMAAVFMQILVRGFLVFEITGSFAALGFLSLASAIPQLIFGFYGGVLADRFPKKLVTQLGQTVGFLNVFTMGLIAAFGTLEYWHLVASGVGSGLLVGMMMPARQAMVHEIVKGDRLMNAVSLNTAGTNVMQIMAPAVGGLVLASWGAEGAFFVMSACYLFAILAMAFVRSTPAASKGASSAKAAVADIVDGIRYVRGHKELRQILIFTFLAALLGSAYMPVFPGFVADVLTDNATLLGILIAISAVGSLAGSLVLASLPDRRRGQLMIGSAIILGVGLLGLSAGSVLWIAIPFMVVIGLGQAGRQSVANTLLQVYSEDAYRGRVMALFMMQFAMMSLGAFVIGVLASLLSIQAAFGIIAVGLIVIGLITALTSRTLRTIE
jgi:MFS family permease